MIYIIISVLSIMGLICIVYTHSKIQATGRMLKLLKIAIDNRDKIIDKMAEDLTTDYHTKQWVIKHYIEEINK